MIYIRAKQGRKLFHQGRIIPSDQFIPVTDDPRIRRYVDHWEDAEQQDAPESGNVGSAARPKFRE